MTSIRRRVDLSKHSIFVTILFPLLLSLILIHTLLTLGVRKHFGIKGPRQHHDELRMIPPEVRFELEAISRRYSGISVEQAQVMAREDGFALQTEDPSRTAPPVTLLVLGNGESVTRTDRGFAVRQTRVGQSLTIEIPESRIRRVGPPAGFLFFIATQIATVLLLCYFLLAWQLKPLRGLSQGVDELALGNLSHRVPKQGPREIARLGEGFNHLAEKISQMIRAKEELVLGVSHELRSPLARMRISIELLDDESRKQQLKAFVVEMESMVNELLDAYRIGAEASKDTFAKVSVQRIFQSMEHRYSGSRVRFQEVPEDCSMIADSRSLERLLSNVIDNALKYSIDGPVVVSASSRPGYTDLTICDSGPGIAESEIPHVFEPFFRADKSRSKATGGFGLGLYLCRKIAEAHGGAIAVSNRKQGGCEFRITIPS